MKSLKVFITTLTAVIGLSFASYSYAMKCKCSSGTMTVTHGSDGTISFSCSDGGQIHCTLNVEK
jgi:hypothetical protein